MTRKIFVPIITFILVLLVFVLYFFKIQLSEKVVSVDIADSVYCEDVLVQISPQATQQTISPEEVIDFSNSFPLYNFTEEPIAIFYKLNPIGYAIYDFTNGLVLQYSTDTDNQVFVDKNEHYYYQGIHEYYILTDDGYLNLATGRIKKLNIRDYLFSSGDFYAFPVLNYVKRFR